MKYKFQLTLFRKKKYIRKQNQLSTQLDVLYKVGKHSNSLKPMIDELHKEIDLIASDLVRNGFIINTSSSSDIYDKAIVFLKSKGLIKTSNKTFKYEPTSEIYEIQKIWIKKYLKDVNPIELNLPIIAEIIITIIWNQSTELKRLPTKYCAKKQVKMD